LLQWRSEFSDKTRKTFRLMSNVREGNISVLRACDCDYQRSERS
jgi:hypothetical protein